MKRRDFIGIAGGLAVAWPLVARAQKTPARIGFLASGSPTSAASASQIDAIKQGFREHGLTLDQDYLLETRFASGDYQRFPEMARDLVQNGVRVILAGTISAVRAAQNLKPALPVVMVAINDPVGSGLVASLARPGGLTTGMATLNQDITNKMLEVQRELVPQAKTGAALFNPANPSNPLYVEKLRELASAGGVAVTPVELSSPDALDAAFATVAALRPDVLHVVPDAATYDLVDRIAARALALKLPSFATMPEYCQFGGLAAYGPTSRYMLRRAGYFVKRILDGANPADLPVEQPMRIGLVINLKTAQLLNLAPSPMLIARADEVIE